MEKILVRVKPGRRIVEDGVVWAGGQTFWCYSSRLKDLADVVDPVQGVVPRPEVHNTAMPEPDSLFREVAGLPKPEIRRVAPRRVPTKRK